METVRGRIESNVQCSRFFSEPRRERSFVRYLMNQSSPSQFGNDVELTIILGSSHSRFIVHCPLPIVNCPPTVHRLSAAALPIRPESEEIKLFADPIRQRFFR